MNRIFSSLFVVLVLLSVTFVSCEKENKTVVIGNEAWTVNRTLTYLTKAVLEEKGYEVKVKNENIEKVFADLESGAIDLYMDAWENAHYVYIYERPTLEDLDQIYTGCKMGIAVPGYFDVDSISQLKSDSSQFNNIFYGIKRNSGVMISSITAFKNYGMDPQVVEMEEDELLNQLQLMYDKQENFIVSAWQPHWKIKHFDLQFLADTSLSFGDEEDIHVYGRPGLSKDQPEVARIASKMFLTTEQLDELLQLMKVAKDESAYELAVKTWMGNNRATVDSWLAAE